ncbi:MAG TPA: S8/S53 family peptidase [Streptosporangiaceae bacterium]|nr:S8/S53 family peptidase [Streptosporangiaceae bacterium]
MPQLARNWYFEQHPTSKQGGGPDHDDDSAPGLTSVPAALLLRHGARVLDPSDAPVIPAGRARTPRTPRPTVYRARTLLIPADLLGHQPFVTAVNEALAPAGMRVVPPDLDRPPVRNRGRAAEVLRRLPRVVALAPAVESGKPVVVDAWTALQTLRAAAEVAEAEAGDAKKRPLTRSDVRRIALEHLLFGSAVGPSTEGNGVTGSPSTEGNSVTGPGGASSYVYRGGDTRAPVAVCLDAPARGPLADRPSRRPVVAVLDTGVRAHSWLDVLPDPAHKYTTVNPDGFVMVDWEMQDAIRAGGADAAARGDDPRPALKGPWDVPVSDEPLLGELNDATGHGTFIAGIVRQVAPDARVLAIRIMHSDDVVNEGDLLCALHLLADRIAAAEAGDMAPMVDVVSLSLGYFDESSADVAYSSGLWQVISLLLELGVAVVAAAGNYSTSRRFYPAAFTLEPSPGPVPLISVGALNPNGSKALFSNGGRWVWAWAAGAAVVSTFPTDINASRLPDVRVRAHPANQSPAGLPASREALDPDDYHGGFATWSGTSFSAPLLAAHIAAKLLDRAADPELGLDRPGAAAAAARIDAALTALKQIQAQG